MVVKEIKTSSEKVWGVAGFYARKGIAVIDSIIDNAVKTCEAILNKVPKVVDDGYNLIIQNLTVKNLVIAVLLYILYDNAKMILGNIYLLGVILGAIAIVEGSIRVR
jgi:hypothetical protein